VSSKAARAATRLIAIAALSSVAVWVVVRARSQSEPPARCPRGFEAKGARCCALGQSLQSGVCTGAPASCPVGLERREQGCSATPRRVRIGPGTLRIGPGDWEAQGLVQPSIVTVDQPFWLDAYEATVERWRSCEAAGQCARVPDDEPGRAVRGITLEQARGFCSWAGGTLPTQREWQFAAAGPRARRYPWGDTGAVCRRASWGMAAGPCGSGADGPDIVGIHADGASPDGVFDLAGGVAEWVLLPSGSAATCGGSWRTSLATGLRTWRIEERNPTESFDDVGVRCRYGVEAGQ